MFNQLAIQEGPGDGGEGGDRVVTFSAVARSLARLKGLLFKESGFKTSDRCAVTLSVLALCCLCEAEGAVVHAAAPR